MKRGALRRLPSPLPLSPGERANTAVPVRGALLKQVLVSIITTSFRLGLMKHPKMFALARLAGEGKG